MVLRKEVEVTNRKAEGTIQKVVSTYGSIKSEGKDYFFYTGDFKKEFRGVKLKKGMKVRFIVAKEPEPGAADKRDRNGKAKEIEIVKG